jgi:pimeloyl-ACP methyl ester carboxylesterase
LPFQTLRDAELHYTQQGDGEPLLLIPGLGMDHTYYRLGVPLLAEHFTVIAVDPRGIGKSTKSPPPYSVEAWADDFAKLIAALGLRSIHVLGSSLGGAMALALAVHHPDKVKSLIVVGGFSELDRATALNFDLRLRLIERLGMSDEVADYMGLWTLTRDFINSDAGFAVMRANQANIRHNSSQLYQAFVQALLAWGRCQPGQEKEPKFTEQLRRIRAPSLVVTSDNDHLIPAALSELIAKRIKAARLTVMPGAGHIPFMEQPKKVARIVVEFLQGLEHPAQSRGSARQRRTRQAGASRVKRPAVPSRIARRSRNKH